MSAEEREIMLNHVNYWKGLMDRGLVVVFGPVLDPQGVYGIGIVNVEDDEQLKHITENDPAAKINRYEMYPMRAVIPQK